MHQKYKINRLLYILAEKICLTNIYWEPIEIISTEIFSEVFDLGM